MQNKRYKKNTIKLRKKNDYFADFESNDDLHDPIRK